MEDKPLNLQSRRERLKSTQAQTVVESTTRNQPVEAETSTKRGRPKHSEPRKKKTITIKPHTQFVLDALRTAALKKNGKKPSEGEIIESALELMERMEGVTVD